MKLSKSSTRGLSSCLHNSFPLLLPTQLADCVCSPPVSIRSSCPMGPSSELIRNLAPDHIHPFLQLGLLFSFTTISVQSSKTQNTSSSSLKNSLSSSFNQSLLIKTALMYSYGKSSVVYLVITPCIGANKHSVFALGGSSLNIAQCHYGSENSAEQMLCFKTLGPWCKQHTNTHTNLLQLEAVAAEFLSYLGFCVICDFGLLCQLPLQTCRAEVAPAGWS